MPLRVENTDITDLLHSSRPRSASTERNNEKVDALARRNRLVMVRVIAAELRCDHGKMCTFRYVYRIANCLWMVLLIVLKELLNTQSMS